MLISSILITGCTTQTQWSEPNSSRVGVPDDILNEPPTVPALSPVDQLIAQAELAISPEREKLYLKAVDLALTHHQHKKAQQILAILESNTLPTPLHGAQLQLAAKMALARNQPDQAIEILSTNASGLLDILADLPPRQQIALQALKANAYEASGHHLAAAREHQLLHSALRDPNLQRKNVEAIWRNINQLPAQLLKVLETSMPDDQLRAWIELALTNRNYAQSLSAQLNQVQAWQRRWPTHIATRQPPAELAALPKALNTQINTIAILLPESGLYANAANLIKEGILLAHYEEKTKIRQPELIFLDTESHFDAGVLYQKAVQQGANVVIGPLNKEKVSQIASLQELPVPVLALNYLPETSISHNTQRSQPSLSPKFFQLGLSAEDEARQISKRCKIEGHRVAGIIYPDSEWGHRAASAFNVSWRSFGGYTAAELSYAPSEDYSKFIHQFLALHLSEQRAAALERTIATSVQFNPRRRQDLDFLVLLANPEKGRLLKPLLNFHFAQDLPVYSTSSIFTGIVNPSRDNDLNNIIFTELPWIMSSSEPLKTIAEEKQLPTSRLLALGIDSYRLHPRLQLFSQRNGSYFSGATGMLTLGKAQRISRTSSWLKFVKGNPIIDLKTP